MPPRSTSARPCCSRWCCSWSRWASASGSAASASPRSRWPSGCSSTASTTSSPYPDSERPSDDPADLQVQLATVGVVSDRRLIGLAERGRTPEDQEDGGEHANHVQRFLRPHP